MIRKRTIRIFTLIATGLVGLAGCGGSGGESTGTLNIGLTDGPVDDAVEVVIQFTGVEVKPAGGPSEMYGLSPDACDDFATDEYCSIDLLNLQGIKSTTLLEEVVPAGEYQWVRLLVNAERTVRDSYVTLEDGQQCSLWIPSGAETGLKIVSGMTVTANGVSNYMLDFDARKSVTAPPGLPSPADLCAQDYLLKPAVRIVDETEAGSIAGTVNPDLLADDSCRDVDNLNVYVFENFDSLARADDYDGDGDPITSAMVEWNGTDYAYEVGYLLAGGYKLGLTCTADVDDMIADNFCPESTCEETTPPFGFIAEINVTVAIDAIPDGNFPAP